MSDDASGGEIWRIEFQKRLKAFKTSPRNSIRSPALFYRCFLETLLLSLSLQPLKG